MNDFWQSVKDFFVALAAFLAGVVQGIQQERARADAEKLKAQNQSLQQRAETELDVQKLPDTELDQRLDRWMRE